MIGLRRLRARGYCYTTGVVATLATLACGKVPEPPQPVPQLDSPAIQAISLSEPRNSLYPDLTPPRQLAPRVLWSTPAPGEGTLVAIVLEPEPRGYPIFELQARAGTRDLVFAPLWGGGFVGLIAAPRSTETVPIEIDVLLMDGSRLNYGASLLVKPRQFPSTQLRVASRYTAPDAATLRRIRRERELVRAALSSSSESALWDGAFVLPLEGVTTSPYGTRRVFNNELRSQHTGLDIDGETGDPVRAANSGRVVLSEDLFYSGQAVYIDHGLGCFTGYFHLSKREVSAGQWVDKGDVVGLVGATGRVTGSHLHWGLYLQGSALDPLSLLDPALTELSKRLATPPAGPPAKP